MLWSLHTWQRPRKYQHLSKDNKAQKAAGSKINSFQYRFKYFLSFTGCKITPLMFSVVWHWFAFVNQSENWTLGIILQLFRFLTPRKKKDILPKMCLFIRWQTRPVGNQSVQTVTNGAKEWKCYFENTVIPKNMKVRHVKFICTLGLILYDRLCSFQPFQICRRVHDGDWIR